MHCTEGIGIWEWAGNDRGAEPDVVLACCGDTPTLEVLAAVSILREHLPELKIRVVNVVDLMKLQSASEHPHGLSDRDYDATTAPPILNPLAVNDFVIDCTTISAPNVRGLKRAGVTTVESIIIGKLYLCANSITWLSLKNPCVGLLGNSPYRNLGLHQF